MKKITLTAVFIISIMLMASCNGCQKDIGVLRYNKLAWYTVEQYKYLYGHYKFDQYKYTDKQYNNLYDVSTGLDFTGAAAYTVKKGDTLSNISRRVYNDGFYYPVIMLASRGVVINPDRIEPGMELTIPDLEKNKANINSRNNIKNCLNGFAEMEKAKFNSNKNLIDGLMKRADAL